EIIETQVHRHDDRKHRSPDDPRKDTATAAKRRAEGERTADTASSLRRPGPDCQDARPYPTTIIRLRSERIDAQCYRCRGGVYERKDFDRAVAEFDSAIRLDRTYGIAYSDRAYAYLRKGDLDESSYICSERTSRCALG